MVTRQTCLDSCCFTAQLTCRASWYCTDAVMASSSRSILSLQVRFRPSQAAFI